MEAIQKKVFTTWQSIDELKAQRNIITLYHGDWQTAKEIEYHNNEIDKGRSDNPLLVIFYGQLDGKEFFLTPIPLDSVKDAKVPIWKPVYVSKPVDNCEALAYWLLRYPICDRTVTEQAARIINKCIRILEEAGSKYRIACRPQTPIDAANVEVKVYAPVKDVFIGSTPLGKMAVLPAEGEAVGVKYTYPLEIIYAVLRENPSMRLRIEGASELALRVQICKEFKLCVAPVEALQEGKPLDFEIRDRALQLGTPRVYITDKLEYVPSVNAPIKEVELVPAGSVEEALIRAYNEYGIMPSPEVHKQLCIASKKLGIFYAFHKLCNIMTKEELLEAARNMAGGAEPVVITIHQSIEGLPRGLIVRDKGTIYVVLEAENPDFYYVENKVVVADLCTALKNNDIAYPPNHKILGELCSKPRPPQPPQPIVPSDRLLPQSREPQPAPLPCSSLRPANRPT
ncbi:MAG: hypothetical protein JZD41_00205, partial [Thermoproteus sp.]|nr:hypothetical protein [Thermoproteus sp.]